MERIGRKYGISEKSIRNHRSKCMGVLMSPPVQERLAQVQEAQHDTSLLSGIKELQEDARDVRARSKAKERDGLVLDGVETGRRLTETEFNMRAKVEEMRRQNEPLNIIVEHVLPDGSENKS